ncbi:hypothetical protein EYF80_059747 [Liparis tanakae]|uniref:Uncharacterized protein n=1 Tax=Liparis tanakae TaxID=230148 RepID=A0A4Z2EMT2_9TELE|nr:hypothetical protein EYF80_059747 [Liparis tanakae]
MYVNQPQSVAQHTDSQALDYRTPAEQLWRPLDRSQAHIREHNTFLPTHFFIHVNIITVICSRYMMLTLPTSFYEFGLKVIRLAVGVFGSAPLHPARRAAPPRTRAAAGGSSGGHFGHFNGARVLQGAVLGLHRAPGELMEESAGLPLAYLFFLLPPRGFGALVSRVVDAGAVGVRVFAGGLLSLSGGQPPALRVRQEVRYPYDWDDYLIN